MSDNMKRQIDIEQQLMQVDFSSNSKIKDSLKEKLLARMSDELSLDELDLAAAAGKTWTAYRGDD